jgi:hypothetical protein
MDLPATDLDVLDDNLAGAVKLGNDPLHGLNDAV